MAGYGSPAGRRSGGPAVLVCTGTNPINGVEIVYDKIGGFNGPMIVVTGAT